MICSLRIGVRTIWQVHYGLICLRLIIIWCLWFVSGWFPASNLTFMLMSIIVALLLVYIIINVNTYVQFTAKEMPSIPQMSLPWFNLVDNQFSKQIPWYLYYHCKRRYKSLQIEKWCIIDFHGHSNVCYSKTRSNKYWP